MLVLIATIIEYLIILTCVLFLIWISMIEILYQNKQCSTISIKNQFTFNESHSFDSSSIDLRLKLNHFTILGTHNSYHQRNLFYRYSHQSLGKQFQFGIRQIELDVHLKNENNVIYHLQLLDDKTSCYCLKHCLIQIRQFMSKNPSHYPIYLFIEIKQMFYEDLITGLTGGIKCRHFQQIKDEILQIFSLNRFILPGEIQGNEKSILTALKKQRKRETQGDFTYRNSGWPPVSKSLGKLLTVFIDDEHNLIADLYSTCDSIRNFYFIAQKKPNLPYSSILSISSSDEDIQLLISSHRNGLIIRLLLGYGDRNLFQSYQLTKNYGIHIISSDSIQCSHTSLCQSLKKDFENSTILCNNYSSPQFCNSSTKFN